MIKFFSSKSPGPEHPDFIEVWDKNGKLYLVFSCILLLVALGIPSYCIFEEAPIHLNGKMLAATTYAETQKRTAGGAVITRIHFEYFENSQRKTGSVRWPLFRAPPAKNQKIKVIKGSKNRFVIPNSLDLIFLITVGLLLIPYAIGDFQKYYIYRKMKQN